MNPMKLIILDRDGVINEDRIDFVKNMGEFIPIPGSLKAISRLKQADWKVAVATNQSGIHRGIYSEETLAAIHAHLQSLLKPLNGSIDYFMHCPHTSHEHCDCRKPKPGLLFKIAAHFQTSLTGVWFVGDAYRDLEAAWAAGCKPILVKTGKGVQTLASHPKAQQVPAFNNLEEAVNALFKQDQSLISQ